MPHLLVRLRVANFEAWKAVFDAHADAQRRAGLRVTHVMRNLDQPNEVVTLFECADVEKGKGFVYSKDVPAAQQQSGVIDKPDIYFLS